MAEFQPSEEERNRLIAHWEATQAHAQATRKLKEDLLASLAQRAGVAVADEYLVRLRMGTKTRITPCIVEDIDVEWGADGGLTFTLRVYGMKTNGKDWGNKVNLVTLGDIERAVTESDDLTTWAATWPWEEDP